MQQESGSSQQEEAQQKQGHFGDNPLHSGALSLSYLVLLFGKLNSMNSVANCNSSEMATDNISYLFFWIWIILFNNMLSSYNILCGCVCVFVLTETYADSMILYE